MQIWGIYFAVIHAFCNSLISERTAGRREIILKVLGGWDLEQ